MERLFYAFRGLWTWDLGHFRGTPRVSLGDFEREPDLAAVGAFRNEAQPIKVHIGPRRDRDESARGVLRAAPHTVSHVSRTIGAR